MLISRIDLSNMGIYMEFSGETWNLHGIYMEFTWNFMGIYMEFSQLFVDPFFRGGPHQDGRRAWPGTTGTTGMPGKICGVRRASKNAGLAMNMLFYFLIVIWILMEFDAF